ncbi:MAG: isoprenylcysteine carboxylmethyltransferase family protein [Zetaproteobacteria bacterium CG06_land_8_20_14_3_00_59_53]|nr:MAG: S-isoprenylcysteine methyltransferase [Zetaproteobacteria bacterium CG23_combo_of_CG06-09_8_20_14_all_59_86]PIQ65439.1 MAG: S-isoprenylcysteine methyltransferase [Zetaproteobacteria bacterium CG11_big_fil_rev_8_21_14_0_20_59_439]PIU69691.1 MAG: isoprenylcysteine carboxylmethyltransferase family protein [Zetaproteobacteria bacterium CG06_land_8_20_14_3_00_59_53]PIU96937.1 MAG: isoprenylcysteine carboxylmethyltransferase family protein [Zetaproteobacteria bacterium CG03_land_8_20_14_0_80_5
MRLLKDGGTVIPDWYNKLEAWFASHRIVATAPVAILLIVMARPTPMLLLIGGLLVVLGEAGRMWSSGHIDKNAELATAGPYAHTRNPLYVANLLLMIGFCVMCGNLWVGVLALLAFAMIYRPVIREEAAHMDKLFGEDYRRWSQEVPLFFPRLTPAPHPKGSFSWALVIQHREHKNAAAFIPGILLFALIYYVRL